MEIRKVTRATLAILLVLTLSGLVLLRAFDVIDSPKLSEALVPVAGFVGTIIGFYFKADRDEEQP